MLYHKMNSLSQLRLIVVVYKTWISIKYIIQCETQHLPPHNTHFSNSIQYLIHLGHHIHRPSSVKDIQLNATSTLDTTSSNEAIGI